ncbi:hypothetical protein Tco_0228640, partial [Tanacetum coccineum]
MKSEVLGYGFRHLMENGCIPEENEDEVDTPMEFLTDNEKEDKVKELVYEVETNMGVLFALYNEKYGTKLTNNSRDMQKLSSTQSSNTTRRREVIIIDSNTSSSSDDIPLSTETLETSSDDIPPSTHPFQASSDDTLKPSSDSDEKRIVFKDKSGSSSTSS